MPTDPHDPAATVRPLGAAVTTTVLPQGARVTGLAILVDRPIQVVEVDPAEVLVTASRPGALTPSGRRTVMRGYSRPDLGVGAHGEPGRYLVLELDPDEESAGFQVGDGDFTRHRSLNGTHRIDRLRLSTADGSEWAWDEPLSATEVRHLLVDDYAAGVHTAASGVKLPFRMFTPETLPGERVPLVVTLHGHGESGTDNAAQLLGNQLSVAFAAPAFQAPHRAFVLSPQTDEGPPLDPRHGWWSRPWQEAVVELVRTTLADHPEIDPDRVHLTGLSMGAFGSWALLPEHRDLFASAVLVCGAGDEATVATHLSDFPIWALHSVDDQVVRFDVPGSDDRILKALEATGVPVTWSRWPGDAPRTDQLAAARQARRRAAAAGSVHLFTAFDPGSTPVSDHHSWIPTYGNDEVLDWLLSHRRTGR